ncbi:MAG: right-handed parallel beta-helix repeat-containing protein [Candidatus Bathyarchaeum sp.]|nr:MAG: right-handed parallel beta-helix repeat-containing protein [Candidatus Bathyarchaeum sp.]
MFTHIPRPEPAFVIRSDGSVDPSTASIHRDGNLYTFTDDIFGYTIIVERDNITLDGGGYSLQGYGNSTGIFILNRHGVTVRNMKISGFYYGVRIFAAFSAPGTSNNNTLEDNLVTDNHYGVSITYSSLTRLRNNRMNNNTRNLWISDNVQVHPQPPNLYINDVDSSNTVDGKPIIYWVNKQDKTVPSDAGYVALINCTNIIVQNLDLAHNGQGIVLVFATNSLITKNHIIDTDSGIFAYKSSNIVITENNLESNDAGIDVRRFLNSSISLNTLTQNGNGACLVDSQNGVFFGNKITRNLGYGIWLHGFNTSTIEQNIITENDEDGVIIFNSCNNTIVCNTIASNGYYGVKLWEDSSENMVSENLIANNIIGVLIRGCVNNSIIRNMITENKDLGLHLADGSNNNVIYHNNFVNNQEEIGIQVLITSTIDRTAVTETGGANVWDNGTAGNYWSDYTTQYPTATEIGDSGIGDTAFRINSINIDRYPLMEPVDLGTIPEFPSWTILPLLLMATLVVIIYKRNLPKSPTN